MQLATAIQEVRARIQELSADFWTANEVLRAINEGVNRFAQEEKWPFLYTIREGVTLTAGEFLLALEEGVAYERHFDLMLEFEGDSRPRMPRRVSPMEGYQLRKRFWTDTTEPIAYYIASSAFVPEGGVVTFEYGDPFTWFGDEYTEGSVVWTGGADFFVATEDTLASEDPDDLGPWAVILEWTAGTYTAGDVVFSADGFICVCTSEAGTTEEPSEGQNDELWFDLENGSVGIGEATSSPGFQATIRFVPAMTRDATIEYQYIRTPGALADPADVLDVPDEYAMGVVAYATGHLFLKELAWSQKADEQFALYRKSVDDAKRQLRKVPMDADFAWGRNEPEFGYMSDAAFVEMVTPTVLGP